MRARRARCYASCSCRRPLCLRVARATLKEHAAPAREEGTEAQESRVRKRVAALARAVKRTVRRTTRAARLRRPVARSGAPR